MSHRVAIFLILLAGLLPTLRAQEPAPAFGQDLGKSSSEPEAFVPTPLGTETGSLAFTTELARSNYLDGGLSVGTTFDDNFLMSNTDRISNWGYSIFPFIAFNQSIPRLHWGLNYAGGFTINQQMSQKNQGSHNANLDFLYKIGPHMDLRARDNFLLTTNFFNQLSQGGSAGQGGASLGPSQTVITPLSKQIGNTAAAEFSYQFRATDVVGAGGGLDFLHYQDVPPGTQLIDTHTGHAQAFYNHRLFSDNWIGVKYTFQRFTYSPVSDETIAHSILATFTMKLRPDMTLTIFAGPQYSDSKTHTVKPSFAGSVLSMAAMPASEQQWNPTGGVSFGWNGKLTSVSGEFLRTLSSGGGYQTVAESYLGRGGVRRQLTRSTGIAFSASYGVSDPLLANSGFSSYRTLSGDAHIEQRLANRFFLRLGYGHDHQHQSTNAASPINTDRNRVWIAVSYDFESALGR